MNSCQRAQTEISFMNRHIILFLFILLFSFTTSYIYSQNTIYFALTKIIKSNNIVSTKVSGGQFITFIGDVCYESDVKSIGVGHGSLKLNKSYTNSNFKVYTGNSFWGDGAVFKFKTDLSVLNVILEDGDVYVYKKQPAPPSVTTCSLIRKKGSSDYGSSYIPINPVTSYDGTYSGTGTTTTPVRNQNGTKRKQQPAKHTCPLCHGAKRIVRDTYTPLYGTEDYRVRCSECGEYFMRSTGHTHITCPQCHGRGYFTTD